jgi:hypothetical protein
MQNFSIGKEIEADLKDFYETKIQLSSPYHSDEQSVRYLKKAPSVYAFNQAEVVSITDLYYNSKFENGRKDSRGQEKIFLNVGKFRADVASKQIDIDTKDFKFIPDDYSDPWPAFFMAKDFKEYAKETYFADLINECVDAFPKYGSVVLKRVGKKVEFVPLQNLRNEQTAKSLDTAAYVIEEHPNMYRWEMEAMSEWKMDGLKLKFNEQANVYEFYGYVPLGWLKKVNNKDVDTQPSDYEKSVYAMVICMKDTNPKGKGWHVFYAEQAKCPYVEAHWSRQHGRWLGIGVMEDLFENQRAKNIIVNLIRRSMQWSAKQLFQSTTTDMTVKNLVRDVEDGDVIEVGAAGQITKVDMASRASGEFSQFLNEFEKNADQKAFTYDVATGNTLPAQAPATIGVILSKATNSFFEKKQEMLGGLFKHLMQEFLIAQFVRDMSSKERILNFFSDEPGFEAIKAESIRLAKIDGIHALILSGQIVTHTSLAAVVEPFEKAQVLPWKLPKDYYKNIKYKFDFTVTGEEIDVNQKIQVLMQLYQTWRAMGDPRAEQALSRVTALGGFNIDTFGQPAAPQQNPQLAAPQQNAQPQPEIPAIG